MRRARWCAAAGRVRVLTSARGYADPSARYPARERLDGVDVRRLGWGSFGKGSLGARAAGGLFFLARAFLRGLFAPRPARILVSTSPPMAPLAGLVARAAAARAARGVADGPQP